MSDANATPDIHSDHVAGIIPPPAPNGPEAQLAKARQEHDDKIAELKKLSDQEPQLAHQARVLAEQLDAIQGDRLIGRATAAQCDKACQAHASAKESAQRAAAQIRALTDDVRRLEDAIARLEPEAMTAKIARHGRPYLAVLAVLREDFERAAASNLLAEQLYRALEREFPWDWPGRDVSAPRPFPFAGGQKNFAWPELISNVPHADRGGRFSSWLADITAEIGEKKA